MILKLAFIPPRLVKGKKSKNWYIEYKIFDQAAGKYARTRIRVNYLKKYPPAIRDSLVNNLVTTINQSLEENRQQSAGQFTPITLDTAISQYLAWLDDRSARKASINSYRIMLNRLAGYAAGMAVAFAHDLAPAQATRFMDQVQAGRISATTYNNYLVTYKTFYKWLEKRGHVLKNPFSDIRAARTSKQLKKVIPMPVIESIKAYCLANDVGLWVAIGWVYYCLIRRTELTRLQCRAIDWEKRTLLIQAEQSKNQLGREIIIPDVFFELLQAQGYQSYPPEYYLMGKHKMGPDPGTKMPGPLPILPKTVTRWFNQLRTVMGLTDITYYQFKHTRLTEIAGKNPVAAQYHARHQDISELNNYMSLSPEHDALLRALR